MRLFLGPLLLVIAGLSFVVQAIAVTLTSVQAGTLVWGPLDWVWLGLTVLACLLGYIAFFSFVAEQFGEALSGPSRRRWRG